MTALLVGTFVVGGVHTLLWIPRAIQWRRELRRNPVSLEPPGRSGPEDAEGARSTEDPGDA